MKMDIIGEFPAFDIVFKFSAFVVNYLWLKGKISFCAHNVYLIQVVLKINMLSYIWKDD